MDAIEAAIAKHGNVWSAQVNTEMNELYEPLHAAQASTFSTTVEVKKAVKYGNHERHRLDVYKPASAPSGLLLVVVFFHGGAFVAGDNDITPSMHGNIGNYFASNGCICFLGTYVLLPEARFPSGGCDTTTALKWIKNNAAKYCGNSSMITAIGQSAGGAHLANAAFSGLMKTAELNLKGLVMLSPPMSYDLRQERRKKNMMSYHNTDSEAEIMDKTAVAVFKRSKVEDMEGLNLLLMVGELDSNEIVDGNLAFVGEYRRKLNKLPVFEVISGHNHISYTLAIGLPGDPLSKRLLEFATNKREKNSG